jgi:hypothetical protein
MNINLMRRFGILLFFLFISSVAFSQTLKITGVDSENEKLYEKTAKRYLGKIMTLEVYDNAIRLKVNQNDEVLKQVSPNFYKKILKDSDTQTETITLEVNTTLSVITSATLRLIIEEKSGQKRMAISKITAKRF